MRNITFERRRRIPESGRVHGLSQLVARNDWNIVESLQSVEKKERKASFLGKKNLRVYHVHRREVGSATLQMELGATAVRSWFQDNADRHDSCKVFGRISKVQRLLLCFLVAPHPKRRLS